MKALRDAGGERLGLLIVLIAIQGMTCMVAAVASSTLGAAGWPVVLGGVGAVFYGLAWFLTLAVPVGRARRQ